MFNTELACIAPQTVDLFRSGEPLPTGYALGGTERNLEFPWCLANIPAHAQHVLDAGSTLNHGPLIHHPWRQGKDVHILTLTPEDDCFWREGISYIYADMRNMPLKSDYYDVVVAISSIEHVGMDNSLHYGGTKENDVHAWTDAVSDIWRVLSPGGTALITVPYGKYELASWYQQFDAAMVDTLIHIVDPQERKITYFISTPTGWQYSDPAACRDVTYNTQRGCAGAVCLLKLVK